MNVVTLIRGFNLKPQFYLDVSQEGIRIACEGLSWKGVHPKLPWPPPIYIFYSPDDVGLMIG
jgi:hypothetical protein